MSWPTVALADVGTVNTGSTPKTSVPEYWNGEIPFVTPSDLGNAEPIMFAGRQVSEAGAAESRVAPKDAVLVCCIGSLGKTGIAGRPLVANQQINWIDFDRARVWPRYGYYVCARLGQSLESSSASTTVPIVNKSRFSELEIPLPPLDEQRRIAAILDQADALRRKRKRAFELLDGLMQSTFLQMFGEAAENPHAFPPAKLVDLCDFRGGSQPPKSTFSYEPDPGKVRLIQIRDYKTDAFATYIPESLAKRPCSKTDVMIGRYGPPLFQILKGLEGSYNVALMKADPKPGIRRSFLFYLLRAPRLQADVISQSERSAGQTGVNLKFLNDYPAYHPPEQIQATFDQFTTKYEAAVSSSKLSMASIEELFSSLQQRAFSGQL